MTNVRFLSSVRVLSSFKCHFKRKYLNLIDSNCDVDESYPWFFIGTVLATGPECIINIQGTDHCTYLVFRLLKNTIYLAIFSFPDPIPCAEKNLV